MEGNPPRRELERQGDMKVDELITQRMADLGITRGQLALRMGWRNPSKGALRIISMCKGDIRLAHSRREGLAEGLAVEVEVVDAAIRETVESRGGEYPAALEPVKTKGGSRPSSVDLRRKLLQESRLSEVLKHNDTFDCALISAVRGARDCGRGRAYTKQENLKRNRNLALKLMYSGYAVLSVKGHWGQRIRSRRLRTGPERGSTMSWSAASSSWGQVPDSNAASWIWVDTSSRTVS